MGGEGGERERERERECVCGTTIKWNPMYGDRASMQQFPKNFPENGAVSAILFLELCTRAWAQSYFLYEAGA